MFFTCFTPVVRENSRLFCFNIPVVLSFDFPYRVFKSEQQSGRMAALLFSEEYPAAVFRRISDTDNFCLIIDFGWVVRFGRFSQLICF